MSKNGAWKRRWPIWGIFLQRPVLARRLLAFRHRLELSLPALWNGGALTTAVAWRHHCAGGNTNTFFTIGHSTRSIAEFVELLRTAGVQLVADVRSVPRSRTNPQYNQDVLPAALSNFQIGYEHIAALGGRHQGVVSQPINAFWQNQSFHNYADYAPSR